MARAEYYVVADGASWGVRHCGTLYPYGARHDAMRAAIDAAHKSGRNGYDAQVYSGAEGRWRSEWLFGHDPYPPTT